MKYFVFVSFYFSVKNGLVVFGLFVCCFLSVVSRIIIVFFLIKILFFVKFKLEFLSEVLEEVKK